jgi:chloramphenicol 3-O-phosphotransferase
MEGANVIENGGGSGKLLLSKVVRDILSKVVRDIGIDPLVNRLYRLQCCLRMGFTLTVVFHYSLYIEAYYI